MKQYKVGNAIVRVHGSIEQEQIKEATEKFMKKVIRCKKKKGKEK